jgi:hypothetical protein
MCIVGNKSDLIPGQRQVTPEQGQQLSKKYNCAWTEASAREDAHVAEAFALLIGQIEGSQTPGEPSGAGKCAAM